MQKGCLFPQMSLLCTMSPLLFMSLAGSSSRSSVQTSAHFLSPFPTAPFSMAYRLPPARRAEPAGTTARARRPAPFLAQSGTEVTFHWSTICYARVKLTGVLPCSPKTRAVQHQVTSPKAGIPPATLLLARLHVSGLHDGWLAGCNCDPLKDSSSPPPGHLPLF